MTSPYWERTPAAAVVMVVAVAVVVVVCDGVIEAWRYESWVVRGSVGYSSDQHRRQLRAFVFGVDWD